MDSQEAFTISFLFIITLMITLCFSQAFDITVANNENETGVDNLLCLIGKHPCSTLDFVFSHLSDCHNVATSVKILDGNYNFTLNSTLTGGLFKNCPAINITGVSMDNTSILCGVDAGFAFQSISQVKIANITLTSCGALRNSTSVNLTIDTPNTTLLLSAALYFTYCKNVQIINVIVQNSNSTGVVMYNTYGNLNVEGSSFNGNGNQSNSLPSNGGFYIEFVYCDPGIVNKSCVQRNNHNASYSFKSNKFSYNYALNKIDSTLFYLPYKSNYYSFGRGGGLSIVFKGNAYNNNVTIDNCKFFGNSASWGGGLLVEFEDFSKNNKMIINNTNFSDNWVIANAENGYGTAGGGVRVGFVIFDQKSVEYNSILLNNCVFSGNIALWGGGLGMYAPSEPAVVNATNLLSFKNCSWIANKALLGSAVDLNYWNIDNVGAKMHVIFSACKFYENYDSENINFNNHKVWKDFNSFGTGALYVNGLPIVFEDYVEFKNNIGSALAVYDTIASFSENCIASFIDNSAWEGGAVALLGASKMWINPHTVFLFQNNKAELRGGAIYVLQTSRHDLLSGGNCFLHYNDTFISSPYDWITNFTFDKNYAPTGSSIFATTLLSCAWGASFGDLNFNLLDVLNWPSFSYNPSNTNAIATEISRMSHNVSAPVDIIPGKQTALPITTADDKGNNIRRSLWLVSMNNNSVQVSSQITDDSTIILQGKPNSDVSIEIVTDSSRVISTKLPVKLSECPPGYYFENKTCQCSFLSDSQRLPGILSCDSETFTAKIKRGYWAGYYLSPEHPSPTDRNLVTGQCPRHYCYSSTKEQEVSLPNRSDITLLNELFCSSVNRTGTLCGRCSNGYGVAINSAFLDCVNCSNWLGRHGWVIHVLSEYVPLTMLFVFVLFFDINLQSGAISSVVLYFQIFNVLNFYSNQNMNLPSHSGYIFKGIDFIYNMWNLEFFGYLLSPYCINKSFSTMDILLIKYVSGFYLFFLFVLLIVLVNLFHVKCCGIGKVARCIRHFCTRCKLKITQQGSTVNGLATLWTLVFTRLVVISGLILSRATLTRSKHSGLAIQVAWLDGTLSYFGAVHKNYVIPALLVLFIFAIIPASSLLCYPLVPQIMGLMQEQSGFNFNQYRIYRVISSAMQKPFIYLKPLIDCFQGDCKPRCEFFASLLFIYRILIVLVLCFTTQADQILYVTGISLLLIIATAIFQPYKKHQDNVVTILCISNISFCSLYYSQTQDNADSDLQLWLWLQLITVLLPFMFFVGYMLWRSWKVVKACRRNQHHLADYDPIPDNEDNALNFPPQVTINNSLQSNTDEYGDSGHPIENYRSTRHRPNMSDN